jgi:hypothetical protein
MSNEHLSWFKSSYSSDQGGMCVEIATSPATIHVRDSKDPHGPQLALGIAQWADFVTGLRAGRLDA